MQLNKLTKLVKKRKVIGRGGDKGGTSGKGNKGQKARSGAHIGVVFEGGQMPLSRRLPKRGFNNKVFRIEYEIVNLKDLNNSFENDAVVNKQTLIESGLIKGLRNHQLKVLGDGQLNKKLVIHAEKFSKSAFEAIKKIGGEAHLIKEN